MRKTQIRILKECLIYMLMGKYLKPPYHIKTRNGSFVQVSDWKGSIEYCLLPDFVRSLIDQLMSEVPDREYWFLPNMDWESYMELSPEIQDTLLVSKENGLAVIKDVMIDEDDLESFWQSLTLDKPIVKTSLDTMSDAELLQNERNIRKATQRIKTIKESKGNRV